MEDIELAELPPPALPPRNYSHRAPTANALQPETEARLRRRHKLCALLEADMKFSHSIQFNAVPDWSSNYISYSNLKKLIYQLEKQINQQGHSDGAAHDAESSPLLEGTASWKDPDTLFARKLDEELEKICSFYQLKELEIFGEIDALLQDEEEFEAEHDGEAVGETGARKQSAWTKARGGEWASGFVVWSSVHDVWGCPWFEVCQRGPSMHAGCCATATLKTGSSALRPHRLSLFSSLSLTFEAGLLGCTFVLDRLGLS